MNLTALFGASFSICLSLVATTDAELASQPTNVAFIRVDVLGWSTITNELKAKLDNWRAGVGAYEPISNDRFEPRVTGTALVRHRPQPKVELVLGNFLPGEGGETETTPSPLSSPFGVDFDPDGTMWIVELGGGRVHTLDRAGMFATVSGDGETGYRGDGGPAGQARFNGMHNVAVARTGDVYIADSWNHCVRKIDRSTGVITTVAGTGEAGSSGDNGPALDATFEFIMCVSLNPANDKIYVADLRNRRIRMFDLKSGIVNHVAGNGETAVPRNGAIAAQSPLVDPRAVAVGTDGRVYVLERSGHALRVVNRDGTIHTVVGTGQPGYRDGPARQAMLDSPKHLCLDEQGRVYIADDRNAVIRRYDPDGETVTTLLGQGRGQPAVSLSHPHGVCVERGRLYVVDTGHNRILSMELE